MASMCKSDRRPPGGLRHHYRKQAVISEDSDYCIVELLVFVGRDSTSKLNVGFTGRRVFIVRGDCAKSIQYMVSDVKMLRSSV
jgi:hypothetical protein